METLEAIRTRRSIRKYTDQPVEASEIKEILDAAMMAPSAGNAQPWQFVVITDKEILAKISVINKYATMASQAPVGILVCGDLSLEKYPGYWVQDCSAAMQNLLLAVHDKGLGAVWTGIYPDESRVTDFRELLGLPDNVQPLGLAVLGHPDQTLKSQSRFREERIHHNKWEG